MVIPTATSNTGALFSARSRKFVALKNEGAINPIRMSSAA